MERLKKLIGENIYLSPIEENDMEKFLKWLNDFQVTDFIGRSRFVTTFENEKNWYEKASREECIFSIVNKENDEVIGNISFNRINYIDRHATLGIMIGESDYRGKGLGTEAIRLLLDFGFNYLNLNSVSLTLLSCNERAKRCYEKVGFKEFGRERMCRFVNGKFYDSIHMDILASEFNGEYIKNKNVK